jgi:hypothetical protein
VHGVINGVDTESVKSGSRRYSKDMATRSKGSRGVESAFRRRRNVHIHRLRSTSRYHQEFNESVLQRLPF